MQLDLFLDGQGNTHHDMYTLSMTDKFASRIYSQYFEENIRRINIHVKHGIRLGYKKLIIPYEKELYTYRDGYIFKYEIDCIAYKKFTDIDKGSYVYIYYLSNVYQQKKETIESMWNIFERDRVYMDKKAIKVLLKNYKQIDVDEFIVKF